VLGIATAIAVMAAVAVSQAIVWMLPLPEHANEALVAELAEPFDPLVAGIAPPRTARSRQQYVETVMRRNLFDSSKVGVVAGVGGPAAAGAGAGDVETDLKLTLLGTIVATNPDHSSALIKDDSPTAQALGYGLNDQVLGAMVVVIEDRRVKLKRTDGREEWLTMEDEEAPTRTATAGSPTPAGPTTEGIEQAGENQWTVSREILDEHLQDLEGLSRMGRALLHRGSDGQFDGYRLSAIRRGSLPDQLGIRNGDVIHAVNGMELSSVQGAMEAYSTLQNEAGFSFEVSRRGQTMTLEYDVR